jgi:hypothetical protein
MKTFLFLMIPFSLFSQNIKTNIINNGIIHTHTVNEVCENNICVYSCKECSFKMEKIKQNTKYSPKVQAMLDTIPDSRAYCPLCSCPRCANVILGLYKGISYEESISNNPKVTKLTNLSLIDEDMKIMFFYREYPELAEKRRFCK